LGRLAVTAFEIGVSNRSTGTSRFLWAEIS
jgi:hypothetical protein